MLTKNISVLINTSNITNYLYEYIESAIKVLKNIFFGFRNIVYFCMNVLIYIIYALHSGIAILRKPVDDTNEI